ncbi:MAG TPA: maltose alpha-D-glucosyltransferase [Candidatus Binatia bacterium]|nr:maltose alpha-D-glucosyltransferase [Candidatus Binatia bacterium]
MKARNGSDDPLWYKNAVIYELHVRAFHDSNEDGIGDLRGLTQKLDYLQDLGVSVIWLLPFYPSPLKDDGYDIADYYSINPMYGTLGDFKRLLREAHARGLRVITELVVNHTSDQHPWFQRSRRAKPGSLWRDFYVWSDTPEKYKDARIIFKDFETSNWAWDPLARAYYWHRFYSHQPDLNYDNPQVHKEITKVLDFWFDMGVDGLRLDAVPYLYEREGTSCENLPETHEFLKKLRRHVDEKYGDRMLLAEANQWPEDSVSYFGGGRGDECHMSFHFPLMPRIFMAVRMEDRVPIVDILQQTPAIPETSQWALFLRNHDELTLEMVTDEERDYMYRVYANDLKARINLGIRRRLAPLLGNDRKKIELLHMLLLSLPGTPVLYYGDEIGMGDNTYLGDRNGVRTPMQWTSDKNAGFSRATPQALYLPLIVEPEYHYTTVNVEAQQRNPHSLLWWTKRVLNLRKRWSAFGHGTLEFLHPENRKVLAFVRRHEDENVLVVANLSRFPQPVELDLGGFKGTAPLELFGRTEFPMVNDHPYFLTLSPHAVMWFSLEPKFAGHYEVETREMQLEVTSCWEEIFEDRFRDELDTILAKYIQPRRWFAGKSRQIKSVHVQDAIPLPFNSERAFVTLLSIDYVQGDPEQYLLPLTFAWGKDAMRVQHHYPFFMVCSLRVQENKQDGILYDASGSPQFCAFLLDAISRRRTFKGEHGDLEAWMGAAYKRIRGANGGLPPALSKAEQSNSSIHYGDKFILKMFRRVETGVHPELEIENFLTEREFPNVPAVAGWYQYRRQNGEMISTGILTQYVQDAKDAWPATLEILGRYFERVRATPSGKHSVDNRVASLLTMADAGISDEVSGFIGTYVELARLLGQRTGELHLAMASDKENRDFAPEPFNPFYQRALFQSIRNLTVSNLHLLRSRMKTLGTQDVVKAERVVALQEQLLNRFKPLYQKPISAMRIRCHGDYHLGQVLYTGKDFIIMDFEGEPARPLGERRIKRTPLRDVAGMLRSFDYATHAALFQQLERGNIQAAQLPELEPWTRYWYQWVSAIFLKAYFGVVGQTELVPKDIPTLALLLEASLLEKAIYEVGYELNNRPDWVGIPLEGIVQLVS